MPMTMTSTTSYPFERLPLDIVGPYSPISMSNNSYILTLQDDLAKHSIAVPIPN